MNNLDLAVIGNCQISALLDRRARIVWSCLPRLDGNPAFCSLLEPAADDGRGVYEVELVDFAHAEQEYLRNTPIVQTTLYDSHGNAVRITDFAPRFQLFGRSYHPIMLIRTLTPVHGWPRLRLRIRPTGEYGARLPEVTHGSNHIRFVLPEVVLRVTTDVSLAAILEEKPFVLTGPRHLVLGLDEPIPESVGELAREHFGHTRDYWLSWVRGLAIPFEWQEAVIRAAITLKLCTYEDTGAVIAAMTTSIPEAPNSGRNWDYRYCWIRDSYFVVQALNSLGATKTMEAYLRYILNVSLEAGDTLQPVYGITGDAELPERIVDSLRGYRGMGPVRVGNAAYEQVQNDVYGAVVLSATQYFFDSRLADPTQADNFERLELLGHRAAELYDQPDAGIWEYRGRQRVHTFSSIMCWAACDRLAKIAARIGQDERCRYWRRLADRIHEVICERAWDAQRQTFTDAFGQPELDASLLVMPSLGFLRAEDPRFAGTLRAIEQALRHGDHLMRYRAPDDFGEPENAFNICTFWYIDALAAAGRAAEARELFENMLACRNSLGLLSEDLDPRSGELWGNFPQTYSMVGIINAARRLSRSWEEAL
ncbi:MAG: glycoside hydrolase family 15 protein [Gammaproteobacteria bacterium]|nr:MAG: glycoside hydrolase family 15 protein [Gammaproteobacteria bacterium]